LRVIEVAPSSGRASDYQQKNPVCRALLFGLDPRSGTIVVMPSRDKPTDEIAALQKKEAKIQAQIKEAKERKKQKELEQEERRKLLAGTVVLEFMRTNPQDPLAFNLRELLDRNIMRSADRALFSDLSNANGTAPATEPPPTGETKP
jgi:predicted metal-dependent hydrolase